MIAIGTVKKFTILNRKTMEKFDIEARVLDSIVDGYINKLTLEVLSAVPHCKEAKQKQPVGVGQ